MVTGYLTVDEVAKTLRVTPRTVRKWLRSGFVTARKFGRTWRVRAEDLDLDGCQHPTVERRLRRAQTVEEL